MSSGSDISPRAKVSYDQDRFAVEFSVQDYQPEVRMIIRCPNIDSWRYYKVSLVTAVLRVYTCIGFIMLDITKGL